MRILRRRVQCKQYFPGENYQPEVHAFCGVVRRKCPDRCSYNNAVVVKLREFRREDFDTLWRIDQKCFEPGIAYSRLELATYIRRRGAFTLVAEAGAIEAGIPSREEMPTAHPVLAGSGKPEILGFIVAEATRRGVGHVISIDVLPEARRLGVGSRLLAGGEDRLRAAGCHDVVLETAADNQAALTFYKRHGYDIVKTVPRYYSNGVDALALNKSILTRSADR
jgi:ribosomal-protein-alanine N-acetyltransferase